MPGQRTINRIKNICKVKGTYTYKDIETAIDRKNKRTKAEENERFRRFRPTRKELIRELTNGVADGWHEIIEEGGPNRETKYKWTGGDKNGGKRAS